MVVGLISAHGLRPSDPSVRARRLTGHRQDPLCSGTRVLVVTLELISLARHEIGGRFHERETGREQGDPRPHGHGCPTWVTSLLSYVREVNHA